MNLLLNNKNRLLFAVIVFFAFKSQLVAQADCATELFPNQVTYVNETRVARSEIDISVLGDMINVPLVAHILSDENLSSGLSKTNLLAAIQDLNDAFETASFHFNLCHINYITHDDLQMIKYSRQGFSNEFTMAAKTNHQSALNIYFVPDARGLNNQSVCGWSSYPADLEAFNKNWIVINNACANNGSTIVHEVGHYFNLYHTHQGISTSLQIEEEEWINQNNCGHNIGDELCDTPAEPYRKGFGLTGTIGEDCTFSCDYFDANGDAYDPDDGYGFNYMSYAPAACRVYFSPGQIKRMKVSYLFDRSYLSDICPKAKPHSTALKDSLYLLALYQSMGGASWSPVQWDLNEPVSDWQGIELNAQGLVTKIELPNNNLTGKLPIEIGNFAALETLILSNNQLTGSLPYSLGNLKALKTLELSHNNLQGSIPAELGYLYQLDKLKLSYNQLSHSIPAKLGGLENLTNLSLMHNALSGCYNDHLNNLCDVYLTSVSQGNAFAKDWSAFCGYGANRCGCNRKTDSLALVNLYAATKGHSWQTKWSFTKSMDKWHGIYLNDLGCVNKIDLSNNQLLGEIPHTIQNLQYLDTLILSNNTVCGNIPSVIGNLHRLKVLDLSDNIITSSIPAEISDLQNLEILKLNGNQLCDYIPHEIGDLTKLDTLFLSDNRFTKCYHYKIIHLIDEEDEAVSDFYDVAINNKCTVCHIDDWTAMKAIYEETNAHLSYTDEGWLSGSSPDDDCKLYNVEKIYLNDYGRVKSIFWNDSGLTGSIPTNINLLEDLEDLHLNGNNLEGSIPSTLSELSKLRTLYLNNNPLMDVCLPSEMLCLCDQTYVFFGNDDHFLENSTQNFELFCNNVANNCAGNDADLIYPGDFNSDGIVNHYDLLNWSIAAGHTGPARTNPSNEWLPQSGADWEGATNGINYKHQDANGDGYINEEDLAVMSLNYNKSILSDNAAIVEPPVNGSGYSLSFEASEGMKNTFDIYLNATDQSINSVNLQGLAFILDLGNLPVEDIQFDFLDANKQPTVESIEEVDGPYEIAFTWDNEIETPVNQPKTEVDPFGRVMIVIEVDSPIDETISLKIDHGIFLNGEDALLSSEVTTLDHYFDNSEDIANIECKDQVISAYFGADQKLYATEHIVSPTKANNTFTTIDACVNVEFKPGGYVVLNPGFYAEYGSTFLAVNRECVGNTEPKISNPNHLVKPISIYPNPATEQTIIAFDLKEKGTISLSIVDVNGTLTVNLLNEVTKTKGLHHVPYNTQHLQSGVYYCTLKQNEMISTQKLIVVK